MYNKWNPYSKEVQEIPVTYWILAFTFIQLEKQDLWEGLMLPQAEVIGNISNPSVFEQYLKHKKRKTKSENMKEGEEFYVETQAGIEGGGTASAKFDPDKGLVDIYGRIIIPKEQYLDMLNLDGVAVSY